MPRSKKDTARDKYLQRVYGINLKQYNVLLKEQGGGCAICGKTPEAEGRNLAVDHSHRPPKFIRGLLCMRCNHRLIGRHTDAELFRKASLYLSQHTMWAVPEKKKKRKKRKS